MSCSYRTYIPTYLFGKPRTYYYICNQPEEAHKCWHCPDSNHSPLGHQYTTMTYRNGTLTEAERIYLEDLKPLNYSEISKQTSDFISDLNKL